jgi:hypothetical protein
MTLPFSALQRSRQIIHYKQLLKLRRSLSGKLCNILLYLSRSRALLPFSAS